MQVGEYQILRELGAGGMGKVFQVRNVISDRIEAMKVLLPDLAGDQGLADRFLREIKVQAALEHPNIAGLRTAMRDGNQLLMVMEYVEGRTVSDYMAQGPMPPQNAAGICMEVLSALDYAHSRGIVHRDIKPSNIMITSHGQVKLMDFGIARVMSDPSLTQTHQTTGSLYYMSPEQINGAALDGRSDIYSLAITLYEMVTGRRPFDGENTFAIMAAHMQQQPVPPVQLDTRVPAGLSDVILAGLAKDPGARYQTAGQFRAALGALLRGPATVAEPHPAPPVTPMPVHPPAAVSPPGNSSRTFYMLAGSLATVAVLALLITQAPRFLKTNAQQQPPAQAAPVEPEPGPAVPNPEPAPLPQEPQAAAAQPAGKSGAARPEVPLPTPGAAQASQPPPAAAVPAAAPPAYTPPPAAQQAAAPAVDRTALDEQRKRVIQMAQRIATAKAALQSLRESMAQQGLRPRAELQGSAQRMQFEMDQADAALNSGDAGKARQHLDYAERALEALEKALNL
jgi:serine/threonine-protein kinase